MCFHSKQSKKAQELEKRFKATIDPGVAFQSHHYNGFNFPKTPVITNENPEVIAALNWGLIPAWAKNNNIRQYTLNARIETIKEKPSFKHVLDQRCLVLADGFYEWKWLDTKGKQKQKYLVSLPNQDAYAYAGIWSEWVDVITGEIVKSYSIITTEANELMSEIHNHKKRMPIILKPDDENKWLEKAPIEEFALPYQVDLDAEQLSGPNLLF